MSDEQLRTTLGGLKSFAFDDVPWTTPKPLHESRVAIVTTAGLRVESNADSVSYTHLTLPTKA